MVGKGDEVLGECGGSYKVGALVAVTAGLGCEVLEWGELVKEIVPDLAGERGEVPGESGEGEGVDCGDGGSGGCGR